MRRVLLLLIITISYQVGAQIPTDHLEAYYSFNGNANDQSSNSNDGTVNGPILSVDRFGTPQSAYTFSSSTDIINVPHSASLNFDGFTDEFSCNLWVKSSSPTSSSGVCRIIEKWNGLVPTPYPLTVGVLNSTEIYNTVHATPETPQARYTGQMWDNKWHMETVIITPDSISMYIDGTFELSVPNTVTYSTQNSFGFTFGNNAALNRPYIGQLDDIRFYSDVLTECEIWSLYKEGFGLFDLAVSQSNNTLTADENNANFQWIDCSDNSIIPGETNQTFTATSNGNYAVILSIGSCSDTSACYSVTDLGIFENDFGNNFLLYPNPTNGYFSIDLKDTYQMVSITITDLNGKLIQSKQFENSQLLNLKLEEPAGIYLLTIESGQNNSIIRLVKE